MKFRDSKLCIFCISVFLSTISILVIFLFDVLKKAFVYNVQINTVILIALCSGIFFVYHRLFLYSREYSALLNFENLKTEQINNLKLIKPISLYVGKSNKLLSQPKFQTIMGSIEKKVEDYSNFPKYLSGVLIFLGLLGTFWGLSHTIGNVANIIDNLGIDQSDAAESFLKLKNSLKIPLAGMGIAFGCSLFGLSGSLILGFLTINQKRVADKFIDKVEEWLTNHTVSFDSVDSQAKFHGSVFSMGLLEKTIETIYAFEKQMKDLDNNKLILFNMQKEISLKISKLTESILMHQDVIKALGKSQMELQASTINLSQNMSDGLWKEISERLSSIDSSIGTLIQETISNKKYIVDALGSDVRMISKTLSALMKE